MQTMLRNQALAIETFQSKWQMAGQEAHAFIARTRSESEDFARAELTAVQRFEDSLQRQYDGQLYDHMLMHYKTNVENMLARRRIRCERSSSMPSLKSPAFVTPNCNSLTTAIMSGGVCRCIDPAGRWTSLSSFASSKLRQCSDLNLILSSLSLSNRRSMLTSSRLSSRMQFDGVLGETRMRWSSLWATTGKQAGLDICKSSLRMQKHLSMQQPFAGALWNRWKRKQFMQLLRSSRAPRQPFNLGHRQATLKTRNKGSSTMVVPVRRRLRTKDSMHSSTSRLVRRRMSLRAPSPASPQHRAPAGLVPGPSHPGGGGDPPAGASTTIWRSLPSTRTSLQLSTRRTTKRQRRLRRRFRRRWRCNPTGHRPGSVWSQRPEATWRSRLQWRMGVDAGTGPRLQWRSINGPNLFLKLGTSSQSASPEGE